LLLSTEKSLLLGGLLHEGVGLLLLSAKDAPGSLLVSSEQSTCGLLLAASSEEARRVGLGSAEESSLLGVVGLSTEAGEVIVASEHKSMNNYRGICT
jgi:hypothetical protein